MSNVFRTFVVAAVFSSSVAFAQNQNPPTAGQPSQPPMQGMPKDQKSPSAGQTQAPAFTPEKCQKEIPKVKKAGESCLAVKNEAQRKSCFDKIGNKFPKEFWDNCRAQLDPLKAEIEAKEKAKYPNQKSGVTNNADQMKGPQNGPNNGPNGQPQNGQNMGPNGQPNMQPTSTATNNAPKSGQTQAPVFTPEKCQKEIPGMKKAGEGCLAVKDEAQRKACFDKIGNKFPKEFWDNCRAQLDPLKAEIEAKEKAKYPNQKSGVTNDADKMKGPQNGPNDGPNGQAHNGQDMGPNGQPNMQQPTSAAGKSGQHSPTTAGKDSKAPNASPAECEKAVAKVKPEAEKCLKTKEQSKRKMCFDKVGSEIEKRGLSQKCPDMMNQMKSEFQNQEAQMYPGQPASIQ